jgi:CcmD family protein
LTALLVVSLLIWAGVFLFVWFVDRRVRDLERRVAEERRARATAAAAASSSSTMKEAVR